MVEQKLTDRQSLSTSSDSSLIHVVEGGVSYKQTKANFLKEDRERLDALEVSDASQGTDIDSLESRVDNLEENQYSGVVVYETLASLPATGTVNTSYKVSNDSTSSNNGYYHWNGSAYVKDSDLTNGVVESGNVDAVSGGTVYDYANNNLLYSDSYYNSMAIRLDIFPQQTDYVFKGTDGTEVYSATGYQTEAIDCTKIALVKLKNIQRSVALKFSYLVFYNDDDSINSFYSTTVWDYSYIDSEIIKVPSDASYFRVSTFGKLCEIYVVSVDYIAPEIPDLSLDVNRTDYLIKKGSNLFMFADIEQTGYVIVQGFTTLTAHAGGIVTTPLRIDSSKTYDYNVKPYSIRVTTERGELKGVSSSLDYKSFDTDIVYVEFSFLNETAYNDFLFYEAGTSADANKYAKLSEKIDIEERIGFEKGDIVLSRGQNSDVKYCVIGDSTVANDNLNVGGTDYEYNGSTAYTKQGTGRRVAKKLGMNYDAVGGNFTNLGRSGWTAIQAANDSTYLDLIPANCDIYEIHFGTNDWGNNNGLLSFGTLNDYTTFVDDSNPVTNSAKAFRRIINHIFSIQTEDKKTPTILFVTPTRRGAWGYKYTDESILYTPNDSELVHGQRLYEIVDLIKEICKYEGFGCIDLYYDSIVNYRQLSTMTYAELAALDSSVSTKSTDVNQDILIDNLHMTYKGYNIIAQRVVNYLIKNTSLFPTTTFE
jgi:hypothetical protein